MENQFNDIEVFKGKSLSNLFEDIYTNHTNKQKQIKDLISALTPLVEGIGDATLLVPLIKEYLDVDIKNDEQLVKLAQIVQRIDSAKKIGASNEFNFEELQNILDDNKQLDQDIQTVVVEAKPIVDKVNKQTAVS